MHSSLISLGIRAKIYLYVIYESYRLEKENHYDFALPFVFANGS